jgi:Flp pilus assembly protein TadG
MVQPFRRFLLPRARRSAAPDADIRSNERGVTLVEFGLFLPILALLLLGTIDLGRGLATKFALEQAAQRTIELATLGSTTTRTDYTFLKAEAATSAGVPVAQVTLDQWLECTPAGGTPTRAATFNSTCATGQQSARYVTITIYQDYTPSFASIPYIGRLATSANGTMRLTADAGVRVQ